MDDIVFKWDFDGYMAIRQSDEVKAILDELADDVKTRADEMGHKNGRKVNYRTVPARDTEHSSIALVSTAAPRGTFRANQMDNSQNHTLLKALGAGEGGDE
ncbi:hypothetical protein [Alloscardovia macacae]|uniref:Uncharacterized protein n=1 Tax=Alloscardovia macacae TaxID=1160091 RepID=A0A261F1Y0_9BIFI|nr:hypothetical protein [Alloscardovia macacae]OZG53101.1 hypothetical protein ALMA_1403 [Alloscardovia macacae]